MLQKREVATSDEPGVYLHTDMDDFTILKMTGELVDIMCCINPDYKTIVMKEKGKKVLCM